MDVARAAMGQGWPTDGGPHPVGPLERRWSERTLAQPGPDERAEGFGYFCPQKSLAWEGETKNISKNAANRNRHKNNQQANTQTCQSSFNQALTPKAQKSPSMASPDKA